MPEKLCALLCLLICWSCETVVDINVPNSKPMVVVNSLFSPDSTWNVSVSYSRYILDQRPGSFDPVGNAVVTILDSHDQPVETLVGNNNELSPYEFKYTYTGNTKPQPNEVYKIQVTVNNEIYEAANYIPAPVPILSVAIDSSEYLSQQGGDIEIRIAFKDPAETKNYYEVKMLSDAYYLDYFTQDTIRYTQDLFVRPVDPALSNDDSNGPGKLLNDPLFNGENYEFRFKVGSYYLTSQPNGNGVEHVRVVLLSVTEEYYRYYVTQSLQRNTQGDPFAQPTLVYTNVKNGLGIFAGFNSSVVELK